MSIPSNRLTFFYQNEPDLSWQKKSIGAFGINVPEGNAHRLHQPGPVTEDKPMSAWLSLPVAPNYYPMVANNNGQPDMHVYSATLSPIKSHISQQGNENPPHQIFQYWDRLDSNTNTLHSTPQSAFGNVIDSATPDRSGPRPTAAVTTPRYRLVQIERLLSFGDESAEAGIGVVLDKDFSSDQLFIFHLQYGSPALGTGLLAIGGA